MMMQEHLIVPSEGGTNPTGTSSSPLANTNRVALNVSLSSMTAMVGSPPPPPNHGLLQGSGGDHQHPIIPHHIHHHSGGLPPDNRYGIFGEKIESFQGIGSGLGSIGGVASVSSDASSSSSSGGGGVLWQSHGPPAAPLQNNQQQITHLPNENDDLKPPLGTGLVQRCGINNSAVTGGQLNGHQHPDLLPPGYIEHHQKQLELANASATGNPNSPSASSPGGGSSCGGIMGATSLLSSPPDIINNSVGATGNSQNKKSSSRRNAWGNLSYADLITQAIKNAPDQRLTLSQVYEWMVANIPYFKDKGDSNSSAGWKNSIRHNLSLHSRFIRVQNEGTGKSSWWMMNPDAKAGSGKNSRRRTPSVDTSVGGTGGSGGPGGVGGRGPDFKRRGRQKKSTLAAGGLIPGHIRNGGPAANRIGNESTPSPGGVTNLGIVPGGPGGLYELNPESPGGGPGMLHHHPQYPFTDMRGHPSVGPGDFPVPGGGRMSPATAMRLGGEGTGVAGFNYPGQEWPTEYPPCGTMPGYFPGAMSRPYGDPLCVDPSNNEYPGARPMSPLHQFQNRSANGFFNRGTTLVPNGGTVTSLFPSQHHNETPFNHVSQHFNNSVNGSHENKLPNSPSNTIIPLDGGNVNRSNGGGQHSYSNLQAISSPNGQQNRPTSFPSPTVDHSSQNPISTTSSSSGSGEVPTTAVSNHMSPIGQRLTPGGVFYPQQASAEDNGNDRNICRSNQKSTDGNDLAGCRGDDNSNQQGSILEKALVKQDQDLLTAQANSASNTASAEWHPPSSGGVQHMNQSVRGNGYNNGGPVVREFMMKQEIESSSIDEYMHHHGHHQTSVGPNHDPLSNAHHQIYANNATLHIPGGAEDHHLIRHTSPAVATGADQYHSNANHHHPPPWVR